MLTGLPTATRGVIAASNAAMIVAIHQPNFFPWLGYFDKIRQADVFVLLDTVQQQKTGGTWTNRVKLLVSGQARWVTAPIERAFSGTRTIAEIRFDEATPWRTRLLRTIHANYARADNYREALAVLEPLILSAESHVAVYNAHAVSAIAAAIGQPTEKFVWSSRLTTQGHGTELLISIVRAVGADTYLCGGGAEGYQDDELFARAGVQLVYQRLEHPRYHQHGSQSFVTGLSVIDALMNCGIQGTRRLWSAQQ